MGVGEDVEVESVTVVSEEVDESDEVGSLEVDELSGGDDDVIVTVVSSDVVGVTLEELDDSELVEAVTEGIVESVVDPVEPVGVVVSLQIYIYFKKNETHNCKLTLKSVCWLDYC